MFLVIAINELPLSSMTITSAFSSMDKTTCFCLPVDANAAMLLLHRLAAPCCCLYNPKQLLQLPMHHAQHLQTQFALTLFLFTNVCMLPALEQDTAVSRKPKPFALHHTYNNSPLPLSAIDKVSLRPVEQVSESGKNTG